MNTTHFMKVQDLVEASTTRHFRNIRNRLKSEGCESGAAQLSGLAAAVDVADRASPYQARRTCGPRLRRLCVAAPRTSQATRQRGPMNEPKIIQKPEAREDYETHDVPFDSLPVLAFAQAPLRQAVADWWRPAIHSPDPDTTEKNVLWKLMLGIQTEGYARVNNMPTSSMLVSVALEIDYPLQHYWTMEAEVPLSELGQIFGLAYDMYLHVYDRAWKDGDEKAPRIHEVGGVMTQGSFVWGHSLDDLVFEEVFFSPAPGIEPFDTNAPMSNSSNIVPLPSVPFLGTFAFGIGS